MQRTRNSACGLVGRLQFCGIDKDRFRFEIYGEFASEAINNDAPLYRDYLFSGLLAAGFLDIPVMVHQHYIGKSVKDGQETDR
jgi:hypothetical protein